MTRDTIRYCITPYSTPVKRVGVLSILSIHSASPISRLYIVETLLTIRLNSQNTDRLREAKNEAFLEEASVKKGLGITLKVFTETPAIYAEAFSFCECFKHENDYLETDTDEVGRSLF
jgi:hypothetical protein